MTWVPLTRARPSPASSVIGLRPAFFQSLRPGHPAALIKSLAFSDENQAKVGGGGQIFAGTHRAFLRIAFLTTAIIQHYSNRCNESSNSNCKLTVDKTRGKMYGFL